MKEFKKGKDTHTNSIEGFWSIFRVPLKKSFRKLTKKFFVDTRRQKRSQPKLREHFDNAVAAEKFESRTKWGFLEVPFKRGYIGIYHYMSEKHLHRYVNEFAKRYDYNDCSVSAKLYSILKNAGQRLTYRSLIHA